MKLAALYRTDAGVPSLHVAAGNGFAAVDELAAAAGAPDLSGLHDVAGLFTRGPAAVGRLRELASGAQPSVDPASVRFAPPVLHPSKIICVGLNYADHISAGITLEPGDIIATGTPSGVALGMNPPVYLEPGDKVSIEIPGIGELVNTVTGSR